MTTTPTARVLCLRPEADFVAVGVAPSAGLEVEYLADETGLDAIGPEVAGLVLPSAGAAVPNELFATASGLRIVQFTGAGTDRVAPGVLPEGCAVCNVPGASAPDVAAYVVLAAGTLFRGLRWGDALLREGRYGEARAALVPAKVRGFRGLRVGIVGFGDIGAHAARLFEAFGCEIAYADPVPPARAEAARYPRMELGELCRFAELLTVHVPLLPATRGLIGRGELAALGAKAVLVNAARGGVVDEAALIEALDAGQLRGVALDVYGEEPLPSDSPLLAAAERHRDKTLLTPHVAGVTPEASRVLFASAWANVEDVLVKGAAPEHQVR